MIKVYSTPTCPWCIMVKKYFDSKNMKFEDIDVSADRDGNFIIGFDKEKIDSLINV